MLYKKAEKAVSPAASCTSCIHVHIENRSNGVCAYKMMYVSPKFGKEHLVVFSIRGASAINRTVSDHGLWGIRH